MPSARAASQEPTEVEVEVEHDEVTRPSDLGFGTKEIEVEPVELPRDPDQTGKVQIRMARTIEEFTYGNPHVHFPLEEGKLYQVPLHVAQYLHGLGALSNIA